jgi:UDP-2-acetamido-3-amino-2,3-dideoxy-glucuronate N-acetyltransferase
MENPKVEPLRNLEKAQLNKFFTHPTAVIEQDVSIGENSKVWHFSHLRSGCRIGSNVTIGRDVFIDAKVEVPSFTKIQNGVSVYSGVELSEWCFVGPHVIFTNDMFPRAGNKTWKITTTRLGVGSSIGAGAVLRCGITIGPFSMVAAGAIVTRDVPPFTLAVGLPARPMFAICACGQTQKPLDVEHKKLILDCCKENMAPDFYAAAVNL